jgi:hypothetical protein
MLEILLYQNCVWSFETPHSFNSKVSQAECELFMKDLVLRYAFLFMQSCIYILVDIDIDILITIYLYVCRWKMKRWKIQNKGIKK